MSTHTCSLSHSPPPTWTIKQAPLSQWYEVGTVGNRNTMVDLCVGDRVRWQTGHFPAPSSWFPQGQYRDSITPPPFQDLGTGLNYLCLWPLDMACFASSWQVTVMNVFINKSRTGIRFHCNPVYYSLYVLCTILKASEAMKKIFRKKILYNEKEINFSIKKIFINSPKNKTNPSPSFSLFASP